MQNLLDVFSSASGYLQHHWGKPKHTLVEKKKEQQIIRVLLHSGNMPVPPHKLPVRSDISSSSNNASGMLMLKMCQCGLKPDAVTNSKGGISQASRRRNKEKEHKICFR